METEPLSSNKYTMRKNSSLIAFECDSEEFLTNGLGCIRTPKYAIREEVEKLSEIVKKETSGRPISVCVAVGPAFTHDDDCDVASIKPLFRLAESIDVYYKQCWEHPSDKVKVGFLF